MNFGNIGRDIGNAGRNLNRTVNNAGRDLNNAVNNVGRDLNNAGHYETNKFDLKSKIEEGNWIVAWSDDISETDVAQGVVAAGVSIFTAEPGPFLLWVENLVNETITSLTKDAQNKFPEAIKQEVNQLAAEIIMRAIQGKDPLETSKRFDTVDFKAGAIKYSGKNIVLGNTISTTWGMKPYIAFRWLQ